MIHGVIIHPRNAKHPLYCALKSTTPLPESTPPSLFPTPTDSHTPLFATDDIWLPYTLAKMEESASRGIKGVFTDDSC